ncbi:MAG TPA: carboxypeptidase-like regulatory domain-containing protein [Candidatus Limnocylindrales bacterium]|nr:carboxypeptidase-like regulatory domain-containing protein [Candidatus Limnocylindrales bacterium]
MATQRRSWLARVGVVLAVSFGALVGVTTPAFAAPALQDVSLNPNTITVGQTSTFRFKLKDNPGTAKVNNVQVIVTGNGSCDENCGSFDVDLNAQGLSENQSVKIKGNSPGQAQVKVTVGGTNNQVGGTYNLAINPAQQQQETTGRLQGEVKDIATGKGIPQATVTLTDGNNKSFSQKTNAAGTYTFDGPTLKVAPGLIVITATRDPYILPDGPKSVQVNPGQSVTLPALNMQTPAASASPTAAEVAPSTDASGSPGPAAGALENKSDDGLDSMTWIMIIVGGVLVALGIGAIVLLLVRRKDDDEEEDEDDQPARGRPGPRGPQPGYRPPPQPTQQYGGPGYGRPADPTMVARPGMSEAPTMMHRPDPYGSQPTQQYGGGGQPTQQYGGGQGGQGGWAPQQQGYGQASGGGGYGSQASGGGAYGGQASGGGAYGGQASGGGAYGGQASGGGGYGGQGGYGGGYGQQPGYGAGQQPGYGAGQYDEPTAYAGGAGGGYDQSGGGYGSPQGYDPGYGQQQGYGQSSGGGGYGQSDQYGQQGQQQDPYGQQGYSDDRRNRGDRRLDWLDD